MANKTEKETRSAIRPPVTYEVRFVGPGILPERIPLPIVNKALSAVQDIASGRDPYVERSVPYERSVGLIDVKRGSARYACVSRSPRLAVQNLNDVGRLLQMDGALADDEDAGDMMVRAMKAIESLSETARLAKCRLEVLTRGSRRPVFTVDSTDYERLSSRMLVKGETTVVGTIKRVGGVQDMRCLLRLPDRTKALYCDVRSKAVAQRLGQHLYEDIVANGTATWIHHTWRILKFEIADFKQPKLGDSEEFIRRLRKAGGDAWDKVENLEEYLREMRD